MRTLPHGTWPSPITASSLTRGQAGLDEVRIDGPDTYWLESRPWESGRVVLVRHRAETGEREDVVPAAFNVRSRVHEYGGGAYAVHRGTIVFSHFADNRLYRAAPGEPPSPITPEDAVRYAGLVLTEDTLFAVREDHRSGGEPVNELVRLDPSGPNDDLGEVLVDRAGLRLAPGRGSGRVAAGLGAVGPPEHAVGLHHAPSRAPDAGRSRRRTRGGGW